MKKIMILAVFAALLSLVSCQKNEPIDIDPDVNVWAENNASPVFTAIINPGTRTTIDVANGKVSWEASDEITVYDAASNSAVYVIESIDATTGKATFVIKEGETALGDGPYFASYGAEPATTQTYSVTAGKLYMAGFSAPDNSLAFTVVGGLMKLNLTKYGVKVRSIAVTGTDALLGEFTYTLICSPVQSISSAKDFYIALPAGIYNKIEITNVSGSKCTLNSTSGIEIATNHIKPVTISESKLSFAALPVYALPGRFSVADNKQVYFSRGNLHAKKISIGGIMAWTWRLYNNQFDCNSLNTGSSRTATEDDAEIDLFLWGYHPALSLNPTVGVSYSDGGSDGILDTDEDWGCMISGGAGDKTVWRTPTHKEWQYLFTGRTNASSLYKCGVTVCGKRNCVVIAPDYWDVTTCPLQDEYSDSSSPMTWAEAQEDGLVCLPAAGYRVRSEVNAVGEEGYYWSSSLSDVTVFIVNFNGASVYPDSEAGIKSSSVRLITETTE